MLFFDKLKNVYEIINYIKRLQLTDAKLIMPATIFSTKKKIYY